VKYDRSIASPAELLARVRARLHLHVKLTFEVQVLEGDLKGADGPASVFIDIIGLPFTPLSFAGVARRTAYRASMYNAATHPYYGYPAPYYPPPPRRGYYPLPPCY
jgi:hypothetical protein